MKFPPVRPPKPDGDPPPEGEGKKPDPRRTSSQRLPAQPPGDAKKTGARPAADPDAAMEPPKRQTGARPAVDPDAPMEPPKRKTGARPAADPDAPMEPPRRQTGARHVTPDPPAAARPADVKRTSSQRFASFQGGEEPTKADVRKTASGRFETLAGPKRPPDADAATIQEGGPTSGRHRAPPPPGGMAPSARHDEDLLGRTLGGCRIESLLGKGGMAVVYLAKQLDLDREVAVKVLSHRLTQDPRQVDQFAREAKTLARLEHPNIVSVYSFGKEDDGTCWLVQQLVRGGSLRRLMDEKKRLPPPVAASYVTQIARALQEAHRAGVVHRDIKPDNVLVAGAQTMKVTDFGLARMAGDPAAGFSAGVIVGTPHYMSPEQVDALPDVDGRTDIYALGATFYQLLTGLTPFTAASTVDLLLKHVNEPLVPPDKRVEGVPADLSKIVCRMMAKDRALRYQTVDELLRDLEAPAGVAAAPVEAAPREVNPTLLMQDEVPPLRPEAIAIERPRSLLVSGVGLVAAAALAILLGLGPIRTVIAEQGRTDELSPKEAAARFALERLRRDIDALPPSERLPRLARFADERPGTEAGAEARRAADELEVEVRRARAEECRPLLAEVERLRAEGKPGPAAEALAAVALPLLEAAGDEAKKTRAAVEGDLRARGVVWLAAGSFPSGEGARARPVVVPGLYVDREEVTAARYARFVAATGARAPAAWNGAAPPPELAALPVTAVSLREAMAYAAWRGGRVPTATEWEKAARGPEGRRWPWGDEAEPTACNWAGGGPGRALAPGSSPRDVSPCGAVDLAGNVAELTLAPDGTAGAPKGWARGGSFLTRTLDCARAAFYQEVGPDDLHLALGLRCVYDAPPAPEAK